MTKIRWWMRTDLYWWWRLRKMARQRIFRGTAEEFRRRAARTAALPLSPRPRRRDGGRFTPHTLQQARMYEGGGVFLRTGDPTELVAASRGIAVVPGPLTDDQRTKMAVLNGGHTDVYTVEEWQAMEAEHENEQ